jgi:hypothetical protein
MASACVASPINESQLTLERTKKYLQKTPEGRRAAWLPGVKVNALFRGEFSIFLNDPKFVALLF